MKAFIIFWGLFWLLMSFFWDISRRKSSEVITAYYPEKLPIICQDIHCLSDSICKSIGVPPELVFEIGQNESGWNCIQNTAGGSDFCDLQVRKQTFNFWYKKLNLEGGETRLNYLICGIHLLKYHYDREGTWKRARFCYGRGSYRSNYTWTKLERSFMNKIQWSDYD